MKNLLTTLGATLCLISPPDLLPEGMKGVAVTTRVDAGAIAADHSFAYTVQTGDTLSAIAKAKLGDEARWKEIAPLNPGLLPDKLTPGQVLWLPPKTAAAAQPAVRVYFLARHMTQERVVPLEPGAEVNVMRGEVGIYLVPASAFAAFEEARSRRQFDVGPLLAEKKIRLIECYPPSRLVPIGDPTHRRNDTLRVDKDAAGKLALSVSSVAYDKNGKEIVRTGVIREGSSREPKKGEVLLLLLALGGGAWLVWRRQHARPQAAMA